MLHNISFVKITIVGPKKFELNAPYFWNNYIICIIILYPKNAQKGVTIVCFHLEHVLFTWFKQPKFINLIFHHYFQLHFSRKYQF